MSETTAKRSTPTWAKVVIGAVSLISGLLIGLALVSGAFLLKTNDPSYKKNIARSIAEFPDPLPSGFSMGTASDLLNVKTILFNHAPEQMDVSVSEIDIKDPRMLKVLNDNFESATDPKLESKDSGTIKIADHILEYKIGVRHNGADKINSLDGRINDIPNKFISVAAFSDGSKPFDMTLFRQLTDSIRGIPAGTKAQEETSKSKY